MSHEVSSQHFIDNNNCIYRYSIIKLVCRTKYDTMSLALTGGRSLVAAPQSGLLTN